MARQWKVLQRNRRWVKGACITESMDDTLPHPHYRRFTATIDGWRNWRIFEGRRYKGIADEVIARVREIQARIRAGDETVFYENVTIQHTGAWRPQ